MSFRSHGVDSATAKPAHLRNRRTKRIAAKRLHEAVFMDDDGTMLDPAVARHSRDQACSFRHTREAWGTFGNFQPLSIPVVVGLWRLGTSEVTCPACKVPAQPSARKRIS